ncbi:MAG: ABC transporter permease [Planctomycetota bacterium]
MAAEAASNATPREGGLIAAATESVADLGSLVVDAIVGLGDFVLFFAQTIAWLFRRVPSRRLVVTSLYQIGVRSLPVVALTGTFIGMVLAVQSYHQFERFGMENRLGVMINLSMYRELGPVLAATMLAGRIGSAIAAEIGTMKVTEQIDALAAMGASPVQHLVVPRLLACFLMIPALTLMAIFMGVAGGAFYCIQIFGVDPYFYFANAQESSGIWDLLYGVIKSVFFGVAIAVISCYRGFHSAAGAEGVGRAATIAFVQAFVVILALDLMLSISLDSLFELLWPGQGVA